MNLRDDGGRSAIGLTSAKARYEYLPEAGRAAARYQLSGIGGKCGPDPTSRKLEAFRTLLSSRERNGHEPKPKHVRGAIGSHWRDYLLWAVSEIRSLLRRKLPGRLPRLVFGWPLRALLEVVSRPGVRMSDHHIFEIAAPRNRYRPSKPVRDRKYLAFVRSLPCLVCSGMRRVEAAHFGPHGIGQKASDLNAIPLCRLHHSLGPQSIHALGPVRFQEQHRLDIPAMIEKLNQFYSRIRSKAA